MKKTLSIVALFSLSAAGVLAATFTVSTSADSGAGSLRQAILDSNASPPPNEILFTLPSPYTITPASPLPAITNRVNINAMIGYPAPTVRLDGSSAGAGASGFHLDGAARCTVQGLRIYNFSFRGVYIDQSHSNTVRRCAIYSNATGVLIQDGSRNEIGGILEDRRNVISANSGWGVAVFGNSISNIIRGNFIGTDEAGSNAWPNTSHGVFLDSGIGTVVGGLNPVPGIPLPGNVISGNGASGVMIDGDGYGHTVIGNMIGTDVSGRAAVSNYNFGIYCYNSPSNTIGGNLAGWRNIISGNRWQGLRFSQPGASHNVLVGNYIGTDASGSNAVPNQRDGIDLLNAPNNRIGGAGAEGNVISGNGDSGIDIGSFSGGAASTGTSVFGNFIGVDASGMSAVSNFSGITVRSPYARIGSTNAGEGNHIMGNERNGIEILDSGNFATIHGNRIGAFNVSNMDAGNGWSGIDLVDVRGCVIGGSNAHQRNIISGNGHYGIFLEGSNCTETVVAGNYIGVDATGTNGLGNGWSGIGIFEAPSNTIGLAVTGGCNIVSDNGNDGIAITRAKGTVLRNNYVGTDKNGLKALGNTDDGIFINESSDCELGGHEDYAHNIVSGNGDYGIHLQNSPCSMNDIRGNLVGTDVTRTNGLGNLAGVFFDSGAISNLFGGGSGDDGNVVAFNRFQGIRVAAGAHGNVILGNSFYKNGGLGIDLLGSEGVTTNDVLDADTGGNGLQNFPILTSVTNNGTHLILSGSLHSAPNQDHWIEFYFNRGCDVSGYGEGEYVLDRLIGIQTDGAGNAVFTNLSIELHDPPPDFVSATAIASNTWNTSEFSPWILLDSDGDGIGDGYEHEHSGVDHLSLDPNADDDHDGSPNLYEFGADTSASDPNSVFRIVGITCNDTQTRVGVETSMHRQYFFRHEHAIDPVAWDPIYPWFDGTGGLLIREYNTVHTTHFFHAEARIPRAD